VTRPIPPRADLAALAQAALLNARDLLADARQLATAGSVPRAHALAVLALEEVGKSNLCMISLAVPGFQDAEEFWKAFRSHEAKLQWARGFLEVIIREPAIPATKAYERLARVCHTDHVRKLSGLYVGYDGGTIAVPAEVTENEAATMISDVQAVLDFQMPAWGDNEAPARLLQRLDEHSADFTQFFGNVKAAIAADVDTAVSRARQVIHEHMQSEPD
jgi:AbiV family abortive infection protein